MRGVGGGGVKSLTNPLSFSSINDVWAERKKRGSHTYSNITFYVPFTPREAPIMTPLARGCMASMGKFKGWLERRVN